MKESDSSEKYNYLSRIKTDIRGRFWIFGGFAVLLTLLRVFLGEAFSDTVTLIVIFLFLFNFINLFFFNKFKNKSEKLIINLYFLIVFLDIILVTIIIHFLGGITWLAPFFYSLIIVNLFWLFPKNKAIFLNGTCLIFLVFLVILEHIGVIPYFPFSPWQVGGENNVQNIYYAIITAFGASTIIFFLSFSSDLFRQDLEVQITKIKEAKEEIKKTKDRLEIEVAKRSKDLIAEKKILEKEMRRRTNELEERKRAIQLRIQELEESHRIAIGRELKMVELKEKIAKLKK